MSHLEPKIYVACLAAYNNGQLHGAWIDSNQDPEAIHNSIHDMLNQSPVAGAEEWEIHDYEDFCNPLILKNASIETLSKIAAFLVEHGELGAKLLDYYKIEDAPRIMEENYCGEYNSTVDFVRDMAAEFMDIPEHLEMYIDYEQMAHDWFICDYFAIELKGNVRIFRQD